MIAGQKRTPSAQAPPPPPPTDLPPVDTDQGPMRGDLLRQIALLEQELGALLAQLEPWARRRATPRRGPALLATDDLERVRDELVEAIHEVTARGHGPA